jgi:tetratricopeptide (TPR) repeat protein
LVCDAILATVENREEDAVSNFEEILKYNPDNGNMHQNYAYTLAKFGRMNDAHKHYLAAADNTSNISKLLLDLAESSLIVLRPGDLVSALERNSEKFDLEKLLLEKDIARAVELYRLFDEVELDQNETNKIYTSVSNFISMHELDLMAGYFRKTGAHGGAKLTFYSGIAGDGSFVADINMMLCDHLIDDGLNHILKNLTYVFIPSNQRDESWLNNTLAADGVEHANH